MTRLRRSAYGTDARLDDLLTEAAPAVGASERGWVATGLRTVLAAAALAFVAWLAADVINFIPPYPLLFALCLALLVLRRAVRSAAEPEEPRAATLVRRPIGWGYSAPGEWHSSGDGMLAAVRRWERRFERGGQRVEEFAHSLAGPLGDLADERLRQRHGCTRSSDPERARRLLGEQAWEVLHGPYRQVPSPSAIVAVVQRMESL
jgi:hypothetical protein